MTTTTTAPRFTVTAYTDCTFEARVPQPNTATRMLRVEVSAEVATKADAEAFVATLPKSWRVFATILHKATFSGTVPVVGYIYQKSIFHANGVNHGNNEAGLKRLRSFLGRVAWDLNLQRSTATPEQFATFLATGRL